MLKAYGITMLVPAPNLKVCIRTNRPPNSITTAFFAGLSRLLLGEIKGRNMQLTTHDALLWDLNNWRGVHNTPPVLEKIWEKLEELGGSYLQPLQNGARILRENHSLRYNSD